MRRNAIHWGLLDERPFAGRLTDLLAECRDHIRGSGSVPMKHVGRSRYAHLVSAGCRELAGQIAELLSAFRVVDCVASDLKLKQTDGPGLSLLVYSRFAELAHPALDLSLNVDLDQARASIRRYRRNRPVLHRKELLLWPGTEEYERADRLTQAEVEAALLGPPFDFGYEKQWQARLASAGFRVQGYELRRG